MVLATITHRLEGKFFQIYEISQFGIATLIETSITTLLPWFNKYDSDFKDGFEPKSKRSKKKK